MADWFRVPPWCMSIHTEASAERARAWVYLLGAWHAGDDPSTREVRRVTGFGQGRADKLVKDVMAWAIANGARVPARTPRSEEPPQGAERERSDVGADPERTDQGYTSDPDAWRSDGGAGSERDRSVSCARDLPVERDVDGERETEASTPPPEKLIQDDRVTGDDRHDTTDDGPRIGSLFPVVASHATTDTPPQGTAAPPRLTPAQRMERAVLAVFTAYRAHHPRKAAEPSPADRKAIRAMLAECGPMDADHDRDTTARAVLLIEWVALSADLYARQLRKDAPWPDGRLVRHDDLEGLSRHVEKRMDAAEAWDRRGRMDAPANAAPTNGAKAGAVIDWAELRRAASLRKSTPTP